MIGAEQARTHNLDDAKAILDVFQKHGHKEIDTARYYGAGSSEEYLGQLNWQERGIIMDTKFFPTKGKGMPGEELSHEPEDLRKHLLKSLDALKTNHVNMWYLHGPDRTTSYEVTLKAVNDLYKEGYFDRFAISNYMAWEVAQICEICDRNGWVKPVAYQGVYNALHRSVEWELFPCLKKYGLAFYAYNPLAGGYLTDRYHRDDAENKHEEGSRFDPRRWQGKLYRARYWNNEYFDALDLLRPVAKKHGLTEAECALRWMSHHSQLKRSNGIGDAIIIGASSTQQLEPNLADLEKGPLPEDVLKALDQGWDKVRGISWKYYH